VVDGEQAAGKQWTLPGIGDGIWEINGMTTALNAVSETGTAAQRWLANERVNVGPGERLASLLGGGALVVCGLSRGSKSGLALTLIGGGLLYRGLTGHCHAYQALGYSSASHSPLSSIPSGQGVKFEEGVTIFRPAGELYAFWRKLENLPKVMQHLVSVHELDSRRSHWVAKAPTGNVEWDAEILTDRPGEVISWRSLPEADVATAGSVHFRPAPGNRGTEVKVVLSYNPPAGRVGATLAWLAGRDPRAEVREDLRAFKRTMEAGLAGVGQTLGPALS
jgi:uncharacterized membrane protein